MRGGSAMGSRGIALEAAEEVLLGGGGGDAGALNGIGEVAFADNGTGAGLKDVEDLVEGAGALFRGWGIGREEGLGGEADGREPRDGGEAVGALLAEEVVGIEGLGELVDADLEADLKSGGEDAEDGAGSGGVAIEEEVEPMGIAVEQFELVCGDGGALGGDGFVEATGVAAEGIKLTFDHEEAFGLANGVAGAVEIKEHVALLEEGVFEGVEVFGLVGFLIGGGLGELACGKGDRLALDIADRDHEAAAEEEEPPVGGEGLFAAGKEET